MPEDQAERFAGQASRFGRAELTRAADIVSQGLTDMRGATAPRLLLEIMCARILLPGLDHTAEGFGARIDRVERRLSVVGEPGTATSRPSSPATASTDPTPATNPTAPAGAARPAAPGSVDRPSSPATGRGDSSAAARAAARPAAAAQRTAQADSPASDAASGTARPPAQPAAIATQTSPTQTSPTQTSPTQTSPTQSSQAPSSAAETPPPAPPSPPARESVSGLTLVDARRLWPGVLERVKSMRRFSWLLLSQNAQVKDLHDGIITIGFASVGAAKNLSHQRRRRDPAPGADRRASGSTGASKASSKARARTGGGRATPASSAHGGASPAGSR